MTTALPADIAAATERLARAERAVGASLRSMRAHGPCRSVADSARIALNAAILARLAAAAEDDAEATCRAIRAEAPTVTPAMLAAAWATWRSRYPERLGPGPAFREAIEAAFAAR